MLFIFRILATQIYSMNISFDPKITELLPHIVLGCLQFNLKVAPSDENLINLINSELRIIEDKMDAQVIRELPAVKNTKEAYKKLGKDPNRYRPSAESLLRRVAKGRGLYHVNNAVDVLNLISIQTAISICGYDSNKIEGDIILGVGENNEPYEGIGRGELNIEKLPVFRDYMGAFGTPTSDSVRTQINAYTNNMLMIFIAFDSEQFIKETLNKAVILCELYANGQNFEIKIIKPNC